MRGRIRGTAGPRSKRRVAAVPVVTGEGLLVRVLDGAAADARLGLLDLGALERRLDGGRDEVDLRFRHVVVHRTLIDELAAFVKHEKFRRAVIRAGWSGKRG